MDKGRCLVDAKVKNYLQMDWESRGGHELMVYIVAWS